MSVHAAPAAHLSPAPLTRRSQRTRTRRRHRPLAALVALALVAGIALASLGMPWARAEEFRPTVSLTGANPVGDDEDAREAAILAGEDAVYRLSVSNDSDEEKFNTSITVLVPNGVSFETADAPLGAPHVYPSGATLPDSAGDPGQPATVPAGFQLWVWQNVADLPAGAAITPTFTVRPDAGSFPVGTDALDIKVTAYTSNNPNLHPSFPGSTTAATDREHTSQPGTAEENTPVHALRIHKSEPSPENELLRGVHNNSTIYTLRVEHTGEGPTSGARVVDYLPAGLEYLGSGAADNTRSSEALFDGNREYPGAPDLTDPPAPEDYLQEDSVETVELTDEEAAARGLGENAGGVYTRVTWTLPDLDGGTRQSWDAEAGVPGEYIIRYRAAVPLFENTLDFDGETPSAQSREQAANLNNNNGPSTRHGIGTEDHIDAQSMRNVATATGTYAGTEHTHSDSEVIDAVDLRILKSVDTSGFETGALATYTLELATSEYASAEDIVITDRISNGMCPVLPAGESDDVVFELTDGGTVSQEAWNDAVTGGSGHCGYQANGNALLDGAVLVGLLYDQATGDFEVTFEVTDMPADAAVEITYTARQNEAYAGNADTRHGPTSSGDSVGNYVQVEATTRAIDALEDVDGAGGTETVWEDSEAWIASDYTEISKSVLERGADVPGGDITGATGWVDEATEDFILADHVWYRLRVAFPQTIETRNPVVTDFLPEGVELREDAEILYRVAGQDARGLVADATTSGDQLRWALGEQRSGSDDLFIAAGTVLDIYVPGIVTGLAASTDVQDMPENLMKYRQENSEGEVYFLRDDATITLGHGMTLVKGVAAVDGETGREARSQALGDGSSFGSDRDGVEVVQGEKVTYRLDITAPPFATSDLRVWDVLPEGIEATDVADDAFAMTIAGADASEALTATVLGPDDDEYPPVGAGFDGRWVIVFEVDTTIPEDAEVTLTYDVVIPGGTLVETELDNTAGIAAYDAETNRPDDTTVTYVPEGPFDPQIEGAYEVPGRDAYDDSAVHLPGPAVAKQLIGSEIQQDATDPSDPHNAAHQIVQGEYVTFSYSVTLPGRTTVRNGELTDRGVFAAGGSSFGYEFLEASVAYPDGADIAGFEFDETDGALTFPEEYTTGEDEETFTVTITVWVGDAAADLSHGNALTNTADFTYAQAGGTVVSIDDSASVQYIDPRPQIVKSADRETALQIGDEVTYTLVLTNPGDRPVAYDNTVVDIVPAGLEVQVGSISGGGAWNAGERTITWDVPRAPAADGEPIEFSYTARIGELAAGAETYVNTVGVTGRTLPTGLPDAGERRGERTAEDDATVTTNGAELDKGVRIAGASPAGFGDSTTARVGETVEYQVEVTLHPRINYYAPVITDTLPAGVEIQEATIEGPLADSGTIDDGRWSHTVAGDVVTWTYDGDITSHDESRVLVLSYHAVVTDGVETDDLPNTAAFTWNRVDGEDDSTRTGVDDEATVNLVHPELVIAKTVNGQDSERVHPGETFTYELTVTNTGDAPAHNIVVTDDVPAGVIVDEATIEPAGVLEGADPETGGGTITWSVPGPLEESGADLTFAYEARLAASQHIAADEILTNVGTVGAWESFDEGGRGYGPGEPAEAEVTPAFPHIALAKAPTGTDLAYAGETFGWTLTANNTGESPANLVELTDTLPANWTFDRIDSVTVAGTVWDEDEYEFAVTGTGEGGDRQVLTWTFDGAPVLHPGSTIEIALLATPSEAALEEAGTGGTVPHTNTLKARATDLTDAEENASGGYTDPETPADAFIHEADLSLTKTAADGLLAGTTDAVGWTIEVANGGPDTAVGPFTVSDTTGALPPGVMITGVSGAGWSSGPIERGEDGATTFEVWRTNAGDTLASGDSFPPIEVLVSVSADVEPVEVENSAIVSTTGTHDPDPSNDEDEDPLPITVAADLAIAKTVNTAEPNAGEAVTWQLDPRNDGPSVSRSTVDAPITITDVIPDGIIDVTEERVDSGEDWDVSASGGFPAGAGDTLTFTYAGDVLDVGAAGSITLTGTIDPSWPAGEQLVNSATIHAGATDDPDPDNNTSTVPVVPETDTSLDITKTRVVQEAGGWVQTGEQPVAGTGVGYLVTVANLGPADARNVTVVDELPGYLAYAGLEDVEGTWQRTGGGASGAQDFALIDPAALAPGETASFVITVTLDSAHTGVVTNGARAGADNSTNTPEDQDDSSSTRSANLTIEKIHEGDAVAGDTLDYTLTVTNAGPSSSSGPIAVEDVLPAGFSYVPGSAQVVIAGGGPARMEPRVTGQALDWTIGDAGFALAENGTIVITFTTAIGEDVPAQTDLVNVATVDGPDDTDPSDNRAEDPTAVVTRADMTIVKDVQEGPWVAGEEIAYTFTVENHGPSAADAIVTDVWPTGLTGVSISGAGWDCADGTCAFDGHPVGTTTLTVVGLIDEGVRPGTELVNTAELTWTDSRGTHEDDDTAEVTVTSEADVALVKTAVDADGNEIAQATAGETARFLLEVSNHGPSTAAAPITVVDTLPEGMSYVGLTVDSAAYWDAEADGRQVVFTLGDGEIPLPSGSAAPELTVIVQLDASLPATDEPDVPALLNVARVSSGTQDPNPPNDEDEAPLEVVRSADLAITKSHEGPVRIDEELTFEVTVTNKGPSIAEDVTVTESVPAGLEYVGYDGGDGAWSQVGDPVGDEDGVTTVEFSLAGELDVDEQAPALSIITTVTADAYPAVTNVVVVDSEQPDPNPADNEYPDLVTVEDDADLTIVKETLTEHPHAGRELTWQLTPVNRGPAESLSTAADPITITDTVPDGVREVTVEPGADWTATASEGFPAAAGDTITFTYAGAGAMPLGETAPVTLTGTIDSAFTGEITNVAEIQPGPAPDRDPDNNADEVTDPVDDTTSLDVSKVTVAPATGTASATPVDVVPGTLVSYDMTVVNTGTADARDVRLIDELPEGLTFDSFEGVDGAIWTSLAEPGTREIELLLEGTLPAREGQNTATVRITADVADDLALDTEEVTNAVTASAENVPEEDWPTDEVTNPLSPSGDLSIVKSHTGATVAGTEVQYTLLATNHGPSVSTGPITVTDVLPEGLSYVEGSAGVTGPDGVTAALEPAIADQELTWVVEDVLLPVEGDLTVTFEAFIAPDVPATEDPDTPALVNLGVVDGPIDDNPGNDEDEDPATITELTDVSIVKTVVGTGPFLAGTEVDFDLAVVVTGPSIARHVVLSDVLPEGLTLVSIGTEDDGWTWDLETGMGSRETLGLGEHVIPVRALIDQAVPAGETLTNTGVVEWTDSEGRKRADDPEDIGVITDADLAIVKTAVDAEGAETGSAVAGTGLRYTFEVTNHGPSRAAALVEITDELPEGVTFDGIVEGDGWAVVQEGQELTFTHPLPLAAGDTAPVLTIATRVAPDVATSTELTNTAAVESVGTDDAPGTPDSNPENNTDEAIVVVERAVDLAVAKSHEGTARIGDELSFDLVVTNQGPSEATDVIVLDTLPAGLTFVAGHGEQWDVEAGEPGRDGTTPVTAALAGPLPVGAQAPGLRITALVEPGAYPEVTNMAEVSSAEPDENPADNTGADPVRVPPLADLGIVKTSDVERLQVGETASYTLTVTNHGPTEHVGEIVVTDDLPTGLVATETGGADCVISEDGTRVECVTSESLTAGESFAITVLVDVRADAWAPDSAEASNTATVTGASEDADPGNNVSTVTTPVDPDVRLELEKTRGHVDGDAVAWTLTVSSVGLNDAIEGAVVVDQLPDELRFDGVSSESGTECRVTAGDLVECLVLGPIPSGESVSFTLRTTTDQAEGSTVTNTAWLLDPETGEALPDSADSDDHTVRALPSTGVAVGILAALALMALLAGVVVRSRVRAG